MCIFSTLIDICYLQLHKATDGSSQIQGIGWDDERTLTLNEIESIERMLDDSAVDDVAVGQAIQYYSNSMEQGLTRQQSVNILFVTLQCFQMAGFSLLFLPVVEKGIKHLSLEATLSIFILSFFGLLFNEMWRQFIEYTRSSQLVQREILKQLELKRFVSPICCADDILKARKQKNIYDLEGSLCFMMRNVFALIFLVSALAIPFIALLRIQKVG